MKKIILGLAIVFSGMLMQGQTSSVKDSMAFYSAVIKFDFEKEIKVESSKVILENRYYKGEYKNKIYN